MNIKKTILPILLFYSIFLLTSCFTPRYDPTRFYNLTALATEPICSNVHQTIGIARATIPDYLDRSKIVIEIQPNELLLAEYHWWAEDLGRSIMRVITENLSTLLPCSEILPAPWRALGSPCLEVHLTILEFKPQKFNCQTLLVARYSISETKSNTFLCSKETTICIPTPCTTDYYLNMTDSMNQALCQLSKEIASNIPPQ